MRRLTDDCVAKICLHCGFKMKTEDWGDGEWQQVMRSCAQLSHCAYWLLMAADSLASQPRRQRSWHYQSQSDALVCTHALRWVQFQGMMLPFEGVMSLSRLFVMLVTFRWSVSLFPQSRGHLYPAWERQEEPSNLWPVYHFKVCV